MNDADLIQACLTRDRLAQKQLYERYALPMFRLCLRYMRSREEAEEVMVGGFLKGFENLHRFENRGPDSFVFWLRRIMVNECLMLLRKQKPLMVDAEELALLPAFERADSQLDAEDLYELVCSLPTGYRTVFNLYVMEGYSHKEIASQLQISENTSKSQLSRARVMMQQLLQKREAHYERK